MKTVLILYYSQSGETARIAKAFAAPLEETGADVTIEALRPKAVYPYPWKSVRRFFDAMPDCILGRPPQIETPQFDPKRGYDLVVLVYPVWFLSPALPIQGFFGSAHAGVLKDSDVISISVSRAMWHSASLAVKKRLQAAGARQRGMIAVTHQGSPLLTLISTPRALLSGKRDRLMGVFPKAGISDEDIAHLRRLGGVAAGRLRENPGADGPLLQGERSVTVNRWLVVPELIAWYCFYAWARIIVWLGGLHAGLRALGVYGFAVFLVGLIIIGLPLTFLGTWLTFPAIRHRLEAYISRLTAAAGRS